MSINTEYSKYYCSECIDNLVRYSAHYKTLSLYYINDDDDHDGDDDIITNH